MDEKYWEERSGGLWLQNPFRETFVKREGALDESALDEFIKEQKFRFPDAYIEFLKKHNGMEVDKRFTFHNGNGTEVTTTVPLVLPFGQALELFRYLQDSKITGKTYFPIALTPTKFHLFLIKAKGKDAGKVFEYDGLMRETPLAFESIEAFFRVLGIL